MEGMQFSIVLGELWALVSRTNKIDEEGTPCSCEDEAERGKLASVMSHLSLHYVIRCLQPFMTESPKRLCRNLT